jgi:hypothetical protein
MMGSSERVGVNERVVHFFDEPGERNTDDVIAAVVGRVNEGGLKLSLSFVSGRTILSLKIGFSVL